MGNSRLRAARGPSPCERARQISRLRRFFVRTGSLSEPETSQSKAETWRQPAWARHRDLRDHVGEPSTRSDELRRRWSWQDVRFQAHPRRRLPGAAGPEFAVARRADRAVDARNVRASDSG